MKPEEKAVELLWKFAQGDHEDIQINREYAVECALICVDEIIEGLKITTGHLTIRSLEMHEVRDDFNYWNDVKNELLKMQK